MIINYLIGCIVAWALMIYHDKLEIEKGDTLNTLENECPEIPVLSWISAIIIIVLILRKNK